MNKSQGKAYATITLDLLQKTKLSITPEILAKQMDIIYDIYDEETIEKEYEKMIENNKLFTNNINGKAHSYIVNIFESSLQQKQAIERFCKNTSLELGKIYITPPGANSDRFYELIKDIRSKGMDVLIVSVFSIYAMPDKEWAVIVKLCREYGINIVEV